MSASTAPISLQPEKSVDPVAGDESPRRWWSHPVLKWVEVGVLVATVAGLISSALYFFVAAKGLDLVVWFEKEQRIYPSDQTDGLALPLVFHNEPARAVTVMRVNVSNLGDGAIGSQENLWQLTISAPKASRLELVGSLERSSERIQLMEITQSTPNAYSVRLGVLERRAHVAFSLMAIHDPATRVQPEVSTSLAGLPKPETTNAPLYERLGEKLRPFTVLLVALGLLYLAVLDLRGQTTGFRARLDEVKALRELRMQQDRDLQEGKVVAEDERVSDDGLRRIDEAEQKLRAKYWRRSRWAMVGALGSNGAAIVFGASLFGFMSASALGWLMTWFI
jgi:hypothetical protein